MHQVYAYLYIYLVAIKRSILEGSKFPVQGSQLRQKKAKSSLSQASPSITATKATCHLKTFDCGDPYENDHKY
jgi:hypothetical protein